MNTIPANHAAADAKSYDEFENHPSAFGKAYLMVVIRKEIDVTRGQQLLFDKDEYFFYITNEDATETPAREVD